MKLHSSHTPYLSVSRSHRYRPLLTIFHGWRKFSHSPPVTRFSSSWTSLIYLFANASISSRHYFKTGIITFINFPSKRVPSPPVRHRFHFYCLRAYPLLFLYNKPLLFCTTAPFPLLCMIALVATHVDRVL
ncbi:hypothetical protein CY34DRAFT_541083 [Suillus luteus UH-Slu-Lm8-n1]|uniref:Uncharacterized protein n=1 Tax=Suillus luteus UH-Slu-Lm8-n1 TaxID=930992 RepID=A0A0D0A5F6_9AGAM|nr:hypothetical protein CY34DRAFT_541083 [Suillus luteus UH-Slu-Lm8-n1]